MSPALNITEEKVLIGLSGGINSMAVLCWLSEQSPKPKELHLYYAHFAEHSPDTYLFVKSGIRFAQRNFPCVKVRITRNSIIAFCRQAKMIPHPMFSPCSRKLKREPIAEYAKINGITIDLIGYVKHELKRRTLRINELSSDKQEPLRKVYPIGQFTDEWCFDIVQEKIGWYPLIYDLKKSNGKRYFNHNNCLPCIKMTPDNMQAVKTFYPRYYDAAIKLSDELGALYWGRDKDQFYSRFGKDLQQMPCDVCTW